LGFITEREREREREREEGRDDRVERERRGTEEVSTHYSPTVLSYCPANRQPKASKQTANVFAWKVKVQ
jgi:hypothetical protein